MIAESFGGWGLEAQKAFKVLGRALSTNSGLSHGAVVAQLYEGFSIRIMRAAARSSLARASAAATTSLAESVSRATAVLASDAS